jgi:hypothetical protein
MKTILASITGVFCVFLVLRAAQEPPPKAQHSDTSVDQMMQGCMSHCQRTKAGMAEMSKMMMDAERSNDPAKMRSALEQAQKTLAQMQAHMDSCMSMIHEHMGGMTQGSKKQ